MNDDNDEHIIELRPVRRTTVGPAYQKALERGVEDRDENNIPVGCPLDRVDMLRYAMKQLDEDTFDPCADCAFFKKVRLDADGLTPVRGAGAWYDYGFCTARDEGLALVSQHEVSGYARKVVADDAYLTNDIVLECIDAGCVTVAAVTEHTGLAERTVFKVLARLRAQGTLAPGSPLRRARSVRTVSVKVASHG